MGKEYVVRAGDCAASIAFDHGLHPNTIWRHAENQVLREKRQTGTVLMEGDRVFVPDRTLKEVAKATDAQHRFVRLGVPETVSIRFLDENDRPRAGLKYVLKIDADWREGKTDGEGCVRAAIPPNAQNGSIKLYGAAEVPEEYVLKLGHLPPITELAGVQTRLTSLGYACKSDDGEFGELTAHSIRRFQEDHDLPTPNGELDEPTRARLKTAYGA